MTPEPDWYRDATALLQELQDERRERYRAPEILGYTDLIEIARGGQGVVYTALQRSTQRRVAIKVLVDGIYASAAARLRFQQEIEVVASLQHPNIVRVYDSGVTSDDRLYYVMEHIKGRPLDEHLGLSAAAAERPALPRRLELMAQVCEAVGHAHLCGVIHRDLKPGNILIDASGAPHILDFGLAKVAAGAGAAELTGFTQTGHFVGSLPWSSPEQVDGRARPADVRTDVYALGVILYQVLTGTFPYAVSGAVTDVARSILQAEPQPPKTGEHVDADVVTIVLRCLAKDPGRRYQSAGDLARDLRSYLASEPIEARRDSTWYVMRKTLQRYRSALVFSIVALVVSIAFAGVMLVLYDRATTAEALARTRLAEARAERDKAAAIKAYLERMLTAPDPYELGRDVTVRQVLDAWSARIEQEFADRPLVQAALHSAVGWTYYRLNELEPAEAHLRQAVELSEGFKDQDPEEALSMQHRLAQVLVDADRLEEAEALTRQVLERSCEVLGPRAWMTIAAQSNYASLLHTLGRLNEAEAAFVDAITSGENALGPDHDEVLVARTNFSGLLQDLGRYDQSERVLREVIAQRGVDPAGNRAALINLRNNLALTLLHRGKLVRAIGLWRAAIPEALDAFGPTHQTTLAMQHNLSSALRQSGDPNEAETITRQLLAHYEQSQGLDHPQTLQTRNQLAVLLLDQERWSEAEDHARRVLEGMKAEEGARIPPLLFQNLASALREQGRLDEALATLGEGFERLEQQVGSGHPQAIGMLNELGKCRLARGAAGEAAVAFRQAVDLARRHLGEDHWIVYTVQIGLGRALDADGRREEARAELQAAYDWLEPRRDLHPAAFERAAESLGQIREQPISDG